MRHSCFLFAATAFFCLSVLPDVLLAQNTPTTERSVELVAPSLKELEASVADIRKLLAAIDSADPEGGLFKNGKADYESKLNEQLTALLISLTGEHYIAARTALLEVDRVIAEKTTETERLESDLMLAPKGNGTLSFTDKALLRDAAPGSENDLKAQIATARDVISNAEQAKATIINDFIRLMASRFDYFLTAEQARALLYQANGGTIVQTRIVLETIFAVETHLRSGLSTSSSPTSLQRYYSVAAVSRLLVVSMYQMHLQQYETRWFPRLTLIEQETMKLMAETVSLMSVADTEAQRATYRNNLALQESMRDSLTGYRELLEKRHLMTEVGLRKAQSEAAAAVNTLKTIDGVFALSAEQFSNLAEYEALMNLSSPELMPLDDEELSKNYLDLSVRLAGS